MDTKKHISESALELPPALIEQYKVALDKLEDIRLVIPLAFNAFEEILRTFLAWRLTCAVADLPKRLNASMLIELTIAGPGLSELLTHAKLFNDLRNHVAHNFHKRQYKPMLAKFVKVVGNHSLPESEDDRRETFLVTVWQMSDEAWGALKDGKMRGDLPDVLLMTKLADIEEEATF